ncbi:FAD-dependent monooxygenase [Corynebacterium minutissimum]|uniref:FAD-dependent monooxygenase n=1 Tax=Corynebacterium minutissimum TaxID=38301 RepID=A0A2X4RF87_9CORY|nr:FAD-dependent monooxygenase [Corynebacterium minutissimum]KHO30074.1 hypothetical protein NX84_04360 [Corynebacterium minutissimum]QPS60558.1 FAD-dependent monooxygenase [Corynebacterium minutissimum]QQA78654.1 FAD-dependent monooxygenase [Corynebacterium minutissimum]SQI00579.1 salicylate hydroxylase [Corynebacterium minutissimum]VEG05353.1 salicylate hydroxylase [Corynebacterium minutissimum]
MRIGIIGAGISGLALGAALHRHGIDVQIYERHPRVRSGGAGITLAPNGLAALDALGIGAGFRELQENQVPLQGGLRRPQGNWLTNIPAEITKASLALDRSELHALLLEDIPGARIHTSADSVHVDAGSGVVSFADGSQEQFDVVIGADGIRSSVRRSCFNDPGISYAGYNAWRAISEAPALNVGFETWGVGARFGAVPLHNGRVYWFAVLSGPEAQPSETGLSQLRDTFGQWHEPIPALLHSTPEESIQYLPIQELASPLPSYHTGKVVLVGDAAHAMTPNLGQGACQGLEDAAVLAALLQNGNVDFGAYDEHRLRRSQNIARRSGLVGRTVHTGGARIAAARNWVLQRMPDAATNRQVQAVSSWEMPAL